MTHRGSDHSNKQDFILSERASSSSFQTKTRQREKSKFSSQKRFGSTKQTFTNQMKLNEEEEQKENDIEDGIDHANDNQNELVSKNHLSG